MNRNTWVHWFTKIKAWPVIVILEFFFTKRSSVLRAKKRQTEEFQVVCKITMPTMKKLEIPRNLTRYGLVLQSTFVSGNNLHTIGKLICEYLAMEKIVSLGDRFIFYFEMNARQTLYFFGVFYCFYIGIVFFFHQKLQSKHPTSTNCCACHLNHTNIK